MTTQKIILYGAESDLHKPLTMAERMRFSARRKVHGYRDVANFRRGDLSHLNYLNYEGRDVINLGDVAIGQSTTALIQRLLPEADILPVNWGELSRHDIKEADRHKTTLIFNGSGYFILAANGRLAARIKDDLDYLRHHAIPAFFFGIGLNRPGGSTLAPPVSLHPDDAAVIAELLHHAQAISVRDASTQKALTPLTSSPIHLTGDPTLHFFQSMGLRTPPVTIHRANTPPLIGLNFSFHGKNSNHLLKKNLEAYCAVLLRLQKETGAEFHYFSHYATEKIIPRLLTQRGVVIKKVCVGDTVALARGYAKLDLHIGGMLHSCILATSAGTPCIALAYDIKHQGFFDLIGLSEHCLSAFHFDPDQLYARALALLADPAPVRAQITARRDALQAATLDFLRHTLPT